MQYLCQCEDVQMILGITYCFCYIYNERERNIQTEVFTIRRYNVQFLRQMDDIQTLNDI